MAETTTDPYKLIDETYANALAQIQQKKQAGELQKAQNEQALQNTLAETNRGYNISYKNAVNPFGYNAEQRGVMGTGVSEYFKNAALGNMMQGQAKAQQTWQSGMNDLATSFNNFLLDLAGQETNALTTKTSSYLTQQQADAAAAQEAARLAEEQRQFNARFAFDQQQYADALTAANAKASGSGPEGLDLDNPTGLGAGRVPYVNRGSTPFSSATINGRKIDNAFQGGKLTNTGYSSTGSPYTKTKTAYNPNPNNSYKYVPRSSVK